MRTCRTTLVRPRALCMPSSSSSSNDVPVASRCDGCEKTVPRHVATFRVRMPSERGGGGSVGYAARLNQDADVGGTLGEPEIVDDDDAIARGAIHLAELLRAATTTDGPRSSCVVHTGAGISRAAGIPDFRGPNGVWTRKARGLSPPPCETSLDCAAPPLTHQGVAALARAGYVRCVVSCNVDCLHLKSGLPRNKLCELHGNCFAERCEDCGEEFVRDFELRTVGFKLTGRRCVRCGGRLRDQVLDWDDALPDKELKQAERESASAALSLVLGTLKITSSPFSLFLIKLTSKFKNFVGTSTTRYLTRDNERWRVGKL